MIIFLLGIFHMSLCFCFNMDYAEERQFMMNRGPNSHKPCSLPRISCPRVPVWPWANLSVSVLYVWVLGASRCSQFLRLPCHCPCNFLHFCRSVLKVSGLYLRKLWRAVKILKLDLTVSELRVCALLHLSLSEGGWAGTQLGMYHSVPEAAQAHTCSWVRRTIRKEKVRPWWLYRCIMSGHTA